MNRQEIGRKQEKVTKRIMLWGVLVGFLVASTPVVWAADKSEKAYKRAIELRKKGKIEEARKKLEEALGLNPNYEKARILLGLTCFQIGEQLKSKGDNASALAMLQQAVTTDPEEAYSHAALSQSFREAGDADNAAKECAEAARLSPLDAILKGGCLTAKETAKVWDGDKAPPKSVEKGRISAPRPIDKPEPPYSEKARQAHLQGTTVLFIVVDEEGDVTRLGVLKPLGLGLDQQALKTVSHWRFEPAKLDGVPVKVKVLVEVQFRLY